jgi:hypothetical protein
MYTILYFNHFPYLFNTNHWLKQERPSFLLTQVQFIDFQPKLRHSFREATRADPGQLHYSLSAVFQTTLGAIISQTLKGEGIERNSSCIKFKG